MLDTLHKRRFHFVHSELVLDRLRMIAQDIANCLTFEVGTAWHQAQHLLL